MDVNTVLKVWDEEKAESLTKWLDKGGWRDGDSAVLDGARINYCYIVTATEIKQEIRNHNLNHLPKIEYADVTFRVRGEVTDEILVAGEDDLWPNDQTINDAGEVVCG